MSENDARTGKSNYLQNLAEFGKNKGIPLACKVGKGLPFFISVFIVCVVVYVSRAWKVTFNKSSCLKLDLLGISLFLKGIYFLCTRNQVKTANLH